MIQRNLKINVNIIGGSSVLAGKDLQWVCSTVQMMRAVSISKKGVDKNAVTFWMGLL